jgi:hypothetical protein
MRLRAPRILMLVLTLDATAQAVPPIKLELATERGLQITAPHEWLQLLTSLGIENVRIRAANPGDKPRIDNRGTEDQPRYHVLAVLTAREELRLPGGTFHVGDRTKLGDYFARLAADGPKSLTAPRGRFGLTENQFAAVYADLAQPLDFPTKDQPPRTVLERLQTKLSLQLSIDPAANQVLRDAAPIVDDLRGLATGTGMAIVLREYGLVLRPEKSSGEPVSLRVTTLDQVADAWPIGWDAEQPPRTVAPALFESLNVEIDGYTLAETLDAIGPRIKIPLLFDRAALAKHQIDPAAVKVALPRTRTYYKRVLDRVLAQVHLAGKLRVDEAGTSFYWITK